MSISEPIDHDDLDERIDAAVRDAEATQSWDDFWAEIQAEEDAQHGGPATEVIRGVRVNVPHDLPLRFDRRLEQLKGSSTDESVRAMLVDLFGDDVLEQWVDAGMTQTEFRVVLMWGMSHGRGKPLSFREAYGIVREQSEGKAKSSTRTSGKSGASGGRSKRTSGGSTSSRRTTSRT
ncbi:hypothetical protein [Streptosporangium sp. NPDC051022]|uniref:hypothetical protein n=1 Tax=Streptosporangium sp. NPDC051022 TaxID=3155752 RepID=UPI0034454B18